LSLVTTAFYDLAVDTITLPPVESRRGAVAKFGQGLLYASQKGRLYYISDVDDPQSVAELKTPIPLPYRSPLLAQYLPVVVSIYDIAVAPARGGGTNKFDLYASHLGLDEENACLHLQLSKIIIDERPSDVIPHVTSDWVTVYTSEPCLPISGVKNLPNTNGGRHKRWPNRLR
jgi:hypothetical protein